jgi:hypothetical protein
MPLKSLLGSAIGIMVAMALWFGLARILPLGAAAGMPLRIGLAVAALLPAVSVLDLMIVVQMGLRVRAGALDPLSGRDGRLLQVNQRVLTNTVEQLAGFAPSLLAVAAGAPPVWMPSIVAAGIVFAVARLVFWAGYMLGPLWRAPGMAASFAINVATLVTAIRLWWPW